MKTFRLPDLGEGLQEAQIVQWYAKAGDDIAADAPLLSVETDKAVTEVPAPWSGRILRLCAEVGEMVKVGAVLVEFHGTRQKTAAALQPHHVPAPVVQRSDSAGQAMPAVRLLARELGLELGAISGTGPGGAVLARDVASAFKTGSAASPQDSAEYMPLTGIRRSMAQNMARSGREVVPATVHDEADLGAWPSRSGLTIRMVRAIAIAVAAEPMLNAYFDQTLGLNVHKALHLGIAVDSADGLLVPVLHDAGSRASDSLGPELERLFAAARSRRLKPQDLKGATFTLSNYGMIGGLHATPVVIPPQVAILGAGRLADRVVPRGGAPIVRPILPLSLTYDHRAITGGEAARFIRALIADLELPE
jgi:2-oxoisovalerate dehydrogenase E2 component (dihydrolipoyl transacylase)